MESSRESATPGTESDAQEGPAGAAGEAEGPERTDESGASGWGASARERVERGLDRGKEAFGAFKEALEETFTDARERGDLTTDRARDLWGRAVDRARDATSDARERFDFASRAEIEDLERRISALEVLLGVGPAEPGAGETPTDAGNADSATEPHPRSESSPGEGGERPAGD